MIEIALIISLASLGFKAITMKGMLLEFLSKPFTQTKNKTMILIGKPLMTCSTCLAGVHSLVWLPFLVDVKAMTWADKASTLIITILIVAIMNTIIWRGYEILNRLKKKL